MNLSKILNNHNGKLKIQINKYSNSHLISNICFGFDAATTMISRESEGVHWELGIRIITSDEQADFADAVVTARVLKGQAFRASVGVDFTLGNWSTDNYVFMPAAVYNGNRFDSRKIKYPPLLGDTTEDMINLPVTITDVPRLNLYKGLSRIQQTTQDPSTPAIGFFSPQTGMGFLLLTNQKTEYGPSGIEINESENRKEARLSLTVPAVREYMYGICDTEIPSDDCGINLKEGDEINFSFRIYSFACPDIPAFFKRFTEVRKDISGPVKLYHELPFSSAWSIQEQVYNNERWYEDGGYFTVGLRESMNLDYQLGWVGGMIATYPLLFAGNKESRRRAMRNMETFFSKTQAPSGFFYGIGDGKKFYCDGFQEPHPNNMQLVRKECDALYYVIKQVTLIQKLNEHDKSLVIPEAWIAGLKRLADAFVILWRRYGQFGQFIDVETGDIIVGGSTSAALAPAGLALAADFYKDSEYLEIAKEAAIFLFNRDVKAGVTTGGPGEILQCPDSESAFALLESFVVLYEATGEEIWIQKACNMADICASWCVSYDFDFPSGTLFNKLRIHTAGSVYASVQNKHSAPGICTMSGSALFRLYRATGKNIYLELAQEISHNLTQYLSREDKPIGKMRPGWMSERINMSDWEGKFKVGETFEYPCWPEVSNMLTYIEVPGLYVQTDTGFFCVFDHVNVEIVDNGNTQMKLKITNPTKFSANIRTYFEKSDERLKPMEQNVLLNCKCIIVGPEETKYIIVEK